MGLYSPSVTNYPSGVVEIVSLSDTSYEEILQSLGSINYLLETIYLYCLSQLQLLEPLNFIKYDVNGNVGNKQTIPAIDPYQYQNALYIRFKNKDYVFNGRTYIAFEIKANQTLFFYFGTISFGNKDFLERIDFFETFSEKICV